MTSPPRKALTCSLFEGYEFLWCCQRPQRSQEELERLCEPLCDRSPTLTLFTFEDRIAIRSLLYAVIEDVNLRNILDGVLLPPPYYCLDLSAKRWTAKEVKTLCSLLNPSLDWIVVSLPLHLAVRLGTYDARLRAAARRLSWILAVPFALVEREENALAEICMALRRGDAAGPAEAEKLEEVRQSKEERKYGLTRAATIGGFALLGGAALIITGGLAAPVVGPAFATLVAATATTLGAIGALGGAVLGAGALSAVFATVVGVATHAAALAAVVTPVLTAANVTAIFGVAGASLGGYKAFRRTTDSDIFALRSVDEIETFDSSSVSENTADGLPNYVVEVADSAKEVARHLVGDSSSSEQDRRERFSPSARGIADVLESSAKPGVVVPLHTRMVALTNAANESSMRKRRRNVAFAVENRLDGYILQLKAVKLLSGVWAITPPNTIPPERAGVFACMNRFAHPTGAGFIVCYIAKPTAVTSTALLLRVWIRAERDFFGHWALSTACEKAVREFDPAAVEYWMDEHLADADFTRRQDGVAMECHVSPFPYVKLFPAATNGAAHARRVTFPVKELPQRQMEYSHNVKQRRKLGVSLVNRSSHSIFTRDMGIVTGQQWPETASPVAVYPAEASLTFFASEEWSLAGAEGYYVVELVNAYADPVTPRFYVRIQFEVSALNNVNVAVAFAYNLVELKRQSLTPAAPCGSQFTVELPPGLFFSLTCVVDAKRYAIQLVFLDFLERPDAAGALAQEKMTLTIGVSGYSAVFDPRRPVQDQQLGLWQRVLRSCALLGATESYAAQWEDEYLMKFGDTIQVNLDIADTVVKKVVGKATSTAQKVLMQGAIFSGFHAFSSLLGAFKLPLFAVWAAGVIDNSFATLSNRSSYTGKDLAVVLLDAKRGNRPVTLVGFSFGSRVIVECLRELYKAEAYGVVENVYLLGSTCSSDAALWHELRRVVAGRLVNVYTREDWMLWMMYRLNKTNLKPMAGISAIHVPGVENLDVTPLVTAHGDYAAKLMPILAAIPAMPTTETWCPPQRYGSPGVVVPVKNCRGSTKAVQKSLHSYLTSTPYVAIGLKNCIVMDENDYEVCVELLCVKLFGCFFDFVPAPLTEMGMATVGGLLGEKEKPMAAVLTYRLRLPCAATRDLLVVLYLYSSAKGDVLICMQPHLAERRSSPSETAAEAQERWCAISSEPQQSIDDVRRLCQAFHARQKLSSNLVYTQSVPAPIPNFFNDSHRTAALHLKLEREGDRGIIITWLALLTKQSTELQQERFVELQYQTAMTALVASHPQLCKGSRNALMELPTVAETFSTDDLQQQVRLLTASLERGDTYPPHTAPFILVNCGAVPLYFCESFYNTSQATSSACSTGGTPFADTPSVGGTAPWIRFPPPVIPASSFAISLLVMHGSHTGPTAPALSVRYETSNDQCAFDVTFSWQEKDTGEDVDSATARNCVIPVQARPYQGEATVSRSTIGAASITIIVMKPRTSEGTETASTAPGDTVEARLRTHGWLLL